MPQKPTTQRRRPAFALCEDLATTIRNTYIWFRRSYRGRPEYESPKYTPTKKETAGKPWIKTAELLLQAGVTDIDGFMLRIFEEREVRNLPPPPPRMLYGKLATQVLSRRAPFSEQEATARQRFNQQQLAFSVALTDRSLYFPDEDRSQQITAVIADTNLRLSPLFRYCVAFGESLEEVGKIWRQEAAIQYCRNRLMYDRVWGDWITPGLKKAGEKLQQRLMEGSDA